MRKKSLRRNHSVHQVLLQVEHLYKKKLRAILVQSQLLNLPPINEEFVINSMEMNADEYNKKMELGKIIAKAIKDGEIAKDSLCSDDSEALHLYWNRK